MNQVKDFVSNVARRAVPLLLVFCLLDIVIAYVVRKTGLLREVIDIQTPAALYAKLDALRSPQGRRIVFVGDSVVYGRRMEEAGDANWRRHTIPAHVETLLRAKFPAEAVTTLNLAMNGALPADIEQVVRLISPLKPDCIVADVSLRAFSADFVRDESRLSRPWLDTMRLDSRFNLQTHQGRLSGVDALETRLQNFALSNWWLYRMRDFVQWRIFDGEPADAVRRFRSWLDQTMRPKPLKVVDPLDEVLLTLKAKSRYNSISLGVELPQVAALKRTLDRLAADKMCAIFFYAAEDKKQRDDLIEPRRYREQLAELERIFAEYADREIVYIGSTDTIKPEFYLDYGHLNDAGNAFVAQRIVEGGLEQALARTKKPTW